MVVSMNTTTSTDVFVAGGGPAGLAAAIAARQRGLSVIVADAAHPPIDKACGEGLLPDAVRTLGDLGVEIGAGDARPLRGIRFLTATGAAAAIFPDEAFGLGIRRTVLHRAMTNRIENLGIQCLWGTSVRGIEGNEVTLQDRKIRAHWIVGADGASSRVRQWAGLDHPRPRTKRYAFRQHYQMAPWTDHVEVYWSSAGQIYVTPVGDGEVGVALISRTPQLRVECALELFPELAARLAQANVISRERGATTGMRKLRSIWAGNVALVGDASGTVDAISGEGIGLGFHQAALLADCLHDGDLASYQSWHVRLSRRPRWMGHMLLALDGRPRLQERTLRVFQKSPDLFAKLLALHVGTPAADFARNTLSLGWSLLTT